MLLFCGRGKGKGKMNMVENFSRNASFFFVMTLMLCCQPIMGLQLQDYAARLGFARLPTRKALMIIGAGVFLTAAAVYFLANQWKKGAASGPPSSSPSSLPTTELPQPEQAISIKVGDTIYSALDWRNIMRSFRDRYLEFSKNITTERQKRVQNIIEKLSSLYMKQGWPILAPDKISSPADNNLIIATIIDELDSLYAREQFPDTPNFQDWFIPLLAFDYSSINEQEKNLIWCYILRKEVITIREWNKLVDLKTRTSKQLSTEFADQVELLLSNLKNSSLCDTTDEIIREQELVNFINSQKSVAILVNFLDIFYATQRAPNIKNFHTIVVQKHNLKNINTANELIDFLLKNKKEGSKIVSDEINRIKFKADNQDFFKENDRTLALEALGQLQDIIAKQEKE